MLLGLRALAASTQKSKSNGYIDLFWRILALFLGGGRADLWVNKIQERGNRGTEPKSAVYPGIWV